SVGAMFCMNGVLLPTVMKHFDLNYTQATLIQVSFYVTYIIFPLPIAWIISRYGYKTSILVALLICASACFLFYPAQIYHSYVSVLLAVFVLSIGITIIN